MMTLEHISCHTVLTLMFGVWKTIESFSVGALKKKKKGFTLFRVGIKWSVLFRRGLISERVRCPSRMIPFEYFSVFCISLECIHAR